VKRLLVLAILAAIAAAPSASAAAPVTPPFIQQLVKKKAGALAYTPTRVPFRYRYAGYRWDAAKRILTLRYADRRFPLDGRHTVTFTAARFRGTVAGCGDARLKTLQLDGNKVYWDGRVAWRCVRGTGGRLVKLAASGPNLPDVALGRVVASAKRIVA
jgi:hypothetical protein